MKVAVTGELVRKIIIIVLICLMADVLRMSIGIIIYSNKIKWEELDYG